MKHSRNKIAAIACGLTMLAGFACAQEAAASCSKENQCETDCILQRDSLFIAKATESITEKTGFAPSASWIGEVWGNVSNANGSDGIHSYLNSMFTVELQQDLSVPFDGKRLGSIGVSGFYYLGSHKDGLGGFESSQGDFSNIYSSDTLRVFEIYYANEFETKAGTVGFRVGQLAADEDFMGMDYSDVFLNSSFGAIPNVAPMELFSQYNVAALGLVVSYAVENIDFTVGIYDGNIGANVPSNNGFDYSNTFNTFALWYQLGYNYQIGGLDGRVMIGGNWHSNPSRSNFSDAFDPECDNFYSFFAGVQQAFINDSEGNAKFGGYARFGWAPDALACQQNFYTDFGFNWFAPLPCRKNDVFAVGVSVVENERDSRYADGNAHYEGMLEATYKIQLTPAIMLQPDFQIYFNPTNRNDGGAIYLVGARAEVVF